MNYIKRLQSELSEKTQKDVERLEVIDNFVRYLHSKKFNEDSTVQVWEVIDVLYEIRRCN